MMPAAGRAAAARAERRCTTAVGAARSARAARSPPADPAHVERAVQRDDGARRRRAIEERGALVVEAGTGVGKTFAYLVPALLSGARTLLSTATKTLQDQLFVRDLPRLRRALNLPVTVALLKGRSQLSLLAPPRAARATTRICPTASPCARWRKIEAWAQTTASGDLAELEGLDERSSIVPLVTSSRENCLGSECPEYRRCHVMKARREAMLADVVVVNHHLFFADMALRDSGVAELLPSVEVAIFDEAHQLAEAGVQFLGTTLGSAQLIDFARDMLAVGLQQARGLAPWQELAAACDHAARELRIAAQGEVGEVRGSMKLRWAERSGAASFLAALARVARPAKAPPPRSTTMSELAPDFVRLHERAAAPRRARGALRRAARRPGTSAGSICSRTRRGWSSRRSTSATRCASRWRAARRRGSSPRRRSATTIA